MTTKCLYYSIKFRLYPTKGQLTLFYKTSGACRWVYNKCLGHKKYKYDKYGENMSKNYYSKHLPQWKEKYPWLGEVPSQALQQSLKDLFVAYDNFFRHGSGFPNFKKYSNRRSFRLPQYCKLDVNTKSLYLSKLGWCRARGSFDLYQGETVNSITVSLDSDNNWYASVLIERDTQIKDHQHKYHSCGIDLGVTNPITVVYEGLDDSLKYKIGGRKFSKDLAKKEKRRKKYQKQYSRKQRGSNNQEKARKRLAKAYYKEKQCRENFQEQTSVRLASLFKYIIWEDLKLSNMTKSAKGTIESPGTNVRAKSGLNRELTRLGLSQLVLRTEQKCKKYEGEVLYVDPRRTSQECSECGHTSKKNRVSRDLFLCQNCSHQEHADVNAGKNIRNRGLKEIKAKSKIAQRAA